MKKIETIKRKIINALSNLKSLLDNKYTIEQIEKVAHSIVFAIKNGNKLLICGNGGSAADSQHMAGEFVCRFYKDRDPLPAIALTTDTSVITAISNDYDYDQVFARQIKAIGKKGDVLLGISTSGTSKNVHEAFRVAREMGINTILLTGAEEKTIAQFSDIIIKTPSSDTPRIQEMHLLIEHIICELVEEGIYGSG